METYFDCTNCKTSIGLMYPGIDDLVECPNCFTMHAIKTISPPELEFEGDSFKTSDSARDELNALSEMNVALPRMSTPQPRQGLLPAKIKSTEDDGHYLCIPFNGVTKGDDSSPGITLANQLEEVLNKYQNKGWQFQRIDTVRVLVQPGCLSSLLGARHGYRKYDIIIFSHSSTT